MIADGSELPDLSAVEADVGAVEADVGAVEAVRGDRKAIPSDKGPIFRIRSMWNFASE